MNATSFDRILRQVLFVPLLALLLAAAALLWQIRAGNSTVARIELEDARIEQTVSIEKLIVDEETGLRGYQTTHDARFLEPYRVAETQLPDAFRRRSALVSSTERMHALEGLEQAYETWHQGFAEPILAILAAGGSANDVELNLAGKRQMDEIRGRIRDLNAFSMRSREGYTSQWQKQVRRLSLLLVLSALVLGLLLGIYTRRLLRQVSDAFRQSHHALRLRAEQAFRSEQKLRTTLQSIGDAVIATDPEGRVTSMNDVAQQLTGWSEQEARNLPLQTIFHIVDEDTREPVEDPVAKVRRLNRVVGLANHTILIRRDGVEMFIDDSGAPIRDKTGQMMGVVLVFRDITLEKKSRDALIANEKLAVAGRLAATIAHEIHNPLDSVSNLLFLMDGVSTPQETAQFLQLAKGEIARVTQISRAMLSLYRESKAPVSIDLKPMLESILLLLERRFAMLGITVATSLPEGLVIHGFPAELRQVFTNLLTNAAEAAGAGTTIELRATAVPAGASADGLRREAGAEVAIVDHGEGIPEAVQAQLFQPFFTTKGEQGTGLGLWVSRGIITKHGGSLSLASSTDAADHGTTVTVYLADDPVIRPGGD